MKWCLYRSNFIILLLIISCKENEIPDNDFSGSENFNRTIKFNINHVYDFSPLMDSVVPGTTINIYASYEDLVLDYYPDATRITNSLGECEISGLDKDIYFIRASHPSFSNIVDSVNTPANTTSFVELIFY